MSKNQFTGTATQPQCNRKFCQFNTDQYCNGTERGRHQCHEHGLTVYKERYPISASTSKGCTSQGKSTRSWDHKGLPGMPEVITTLVDVCLHVNTDK